MALGTVKRSIDTGAILSLRLITLPNDEDVNLFCLSLNQSLLFRPTISLKIEQFYCSCTNFTKSSHRDLKRVNPSLVLTCARLHFQYGAGNCKKVYWYRSNTLPSIDHPSKWWGCQSFLSLLKPIFAFSLKSSWDLAGHSLIFANTNIVINAL